MLMFSFVLVEKHGHREYCSKVPESSYCLFWVVFAACLSLVNTWIKTR